MDEPTLVLALTQEGRPWQPRCSGETTSLRVPKLAPCHASEGVRKGGVEPPKPFGYRILSPARLPVPPLSPVTGRPRCWAGFL